MDHSRFGNNPPPAAPATWAMGTPVPPYGQPATGCPPVNYVESSSSVSAGPSTGHYPSSGGASSFSSASNNRTGNPYVNISPVSNSSNASGSPYVNVSPVPSESPTDTLLKVLGRCGKKLEDTTRKAGGAAGNHMLSMTFKDDIIVYGFGFLLHVLQVKTSPSLTDAAFARISQGTKVLAEGGNDKVFKQTFGTFPGEELRKAYACYISTSAGPVIGTLYLSTAKIAFCSDNPLSNNSSNVQQESAYFKVVVPLNRLRAVNPSASTRNPSDKYIQIVTMDNHEFWFMGFVSYDKALKNLREALPFSSHASHF
ncbi:GEM-like protein 1 [Canna indica]|uniref:GEM-like protein 1 n=1 Tax=Canna indica TaxID=4628 RepID=A0AAQ3QR62_9LILI|nr:GEM-like protein 1 [Canna indica]